MDIILLSGGNSDIKIPDYGGWTYSAIAALSNMISAFNLPAFAEELNLAAK